MILDLYKSVLLSVNCVVDDDGMISYLIGGREKMPVQINGKRLVLPQPNVLKNPNWESTIAFHPLSESILRGESPVLRRLKLLATCRLTEVITCLTTELMEIAVDTDCHKKLSPSENEFLSLIPGVSEKSHTLKDTERLFDETTIDGPHKVVSLYMKRGGKYKGKSYQRVAVVDFPIVKDFEAEGKKIFDVNLSSIKNKKAIAALFEFVLPHSGEPEYYSYGSNSMVAPYFHAFMSAYYNVAKQLNKITRKFKKHLDNPDGLMIDTEFEKHLNNLPDFIDMIPSLSGNEGELTDAPDAGAAVALSGPSTKHHARIQEAVIEANLEAAAVAANKPAPILPWENAPATPAYAPQPVAAVSTGKGLSWDKIINTNPVLAAAAGVVHQVAMPFGVGNQWGQQQQQFGQQQQQMTRGGYAVQQPLNPWGQQQQQPFAQFGQQQQPGVMYPNGI